MTQFYLMFGLRLVFNFIVIYLDSPNPLIVEDTGRN